MTAPEIAPRGTFRATVAVWVVALVVALVVGLLSPAEERMQWMTVGFGGCVILAFVVQLAFGRSKGFIDRLAASVAGALVLMGLVSAVFGLVALIPG